MVIHQNIPAMKNTALLFTAAIILAAVSCRKTALYEYPSNSSPDAEITNFSLLDAEGKEVITDIEISSGTGEIHATVLTGTDITGLVPRATVSEGVIVEPPMGVYTDFSEAVTYTLIAGNRTDKKEWTIYVN